MLVAQDFRDRARLALSGRWGVAVGTGFVASLLGAGTIMVGSGGGSSSSNDAESYETMYEQMPQEVLMTVAAVMMIVAGIMLIWALVVFILGGPITLGYVKFNLNLIDDNNPEFGDLFSQFGRFGDGFLVQFLRGLFVGLWTLLFMIPCLLLAIILAVAAVTGGSTSAIVILAFLMIVCMIPGVGIALYKQYSYSMAAYILYEVPEIGANQAIKESIRLMNGNKWRLFCLNFSFIGWAFLSILTCGILFLWIKPYQEASYAAFYREIKRERYGEPVVQSYTSPYEQGSVYSDYSNVDL